MAGEKLINKRPFNFLSKIKQVFGSNNSDSKPEILGAKDTGEIIECVNGRMGDGKGGALDSRSSIGGEYELFSNEAGGNYTCIASVSVNEKLIEFWCASASLGKTYITVDGVIMSFAEWLFRYDHPLQIDINENALGGEIYITDNLTTPVYISLQDMIDNYNAPTLKYFDDFNRALYEINQYIPADQIIFKGIESVGTGNGLPVGQYSYSHRYASFDGSRTAWSVYTPLSFVPQHYDFSSGAGDIFPYLKTQGNDPNPANIGSYGLRLNVRINNSYNYDYIEIKVIEYNLGSGISYTPSPKIIYSQNINPGDFFILEYIDSKSSRNKNIAISQEEELSTMSVIKKAKAIRYFFNKVELGNVEYESREVSDSNYHFIEDGGGDAEVYPVIKDIGLGGHKIDLNHTYKKGYMNGDRYGFYCIFWDGNYTKSFAVPVTGQTNFKFPELRDQMINGSLSDLNSDGTVTTSTSIPYYVDNVNWHGKTFEAVDYNGLIKKQLDPSDDSTKLTKNTFQASSTPATRTGFYSLSPSGPRYIPFYPTAVFSLLKENSFRPNSHVHLEGNILTPDPVPTPEDYNPCLFAPRYNALGLNITGLDNYPSWAKSFSIVRSKPAKRVICQGFAFYKLDETVSPSAIVVNPKIKNQVVVHIPDIENGIVPSSFIDEITANPTAYKIQFVRPVGFGSEVWNKETVEPAVGAGSFKAPNPGYGHKIDMVAYARLQRELDGGTPIRVNVGEVATDVGQSPGANEGVVTFGLWRNQTKWAADHASSLFGTTTNPLFDMSSFSQSATEEDGVQLFNITTVQDIYLEDGASIISTHRQFSAPFIDARDYHEPVYIFNIVADDASAPEQDFQEVISTGHYQKIIATVGYGSGVSNQELVVCGEREEDYYNADNLYDNYIWVEINGQFRRYININTKSGGQLASIGAAISGNTTYTSDVTKQPAVRIYGRFHLDSDRNIILDDSVDLGIEIQVRYDNRFPLTIFGGDTFVGTATAAPYNRSVEDGGSVNSSNNFFAINGTSLFNLPALPYGWFDLNSRYTPIGKGNIGSVGILEQYQDPTDISFNQGYRQIIALYECQCRFAIHLSYGDCYPNVSYVQRPLHWDAAQTAIDNGYYPQYESDYPDEYKRWKFGGFRVKQFPTNTDLGRVESHDKYIVSSSVYNRESTIFNTRIAWSETRPIQSYSAPNLKAFRPFNIFDLSDQYGEIKRFYTERSASFQENLYALCEQNICLALTRKKTLTDAGGTALNIQEQNDTNFILDQLWVGNVADGALHRDYWLTAAESGEALYFANMNSVFKFQGNKQIDIARGNSYYKTIHDLFITRNTSNLESDYKDKITSVWDKVNKEYWICANFKERLYQIDAGNNPFVTDGQTEDGIVYPVIDLFGNGGFVTFIGAGTSTSLFINVKASGQDIEYQFADSTSIEGTLLKGEKYELQYDANLTQYLLRKIDSDNIYSRNNFVFSYYDYNKSNGWNGIFDYMFDRYCSTRLKMYGSRNLLDGAGFIKTFQLNEGLVINGESINFQLYGSINPEVVKSVEFIRIRVGSDIKPTNVLFYDKSDTLVSVGVINSSSLKNYHQFESYIPKHSTLRVRRQGTYLLFRVTHKDYNKFNISFISFDYKIIR